MAQILCVLQLLRNSNSNSSRSRELRNWELGIGIGIGTEPRVELNWAWPPIYTRTCKWMHYRAARPVSSSLSPRPVCIYNTDSLYCSLSKPNAGSSQKILQHAGDQKRGQNMRSAKISHSPGDLQPIKNETVLLKRKTLTLPLSHF